MTSFGRHGLGKPLGMWVTALNINIWNVSVGDNFGRHGLGNP